MPMNYSNTRWDVLWHPPKKQTNKQKTHKIFIPPDRPKASFFKKLLNLFWGVDPDAGKD